MLKHLSVGKKMSVGFGAQILLICLSALIAFVSAFNRTSTFHAIDHVSAMQADISAELQTFNRTRLLAQEVILEIDHTVHAAFQQQAAELLAVLDGLEARAADMDDFLLDEIIVLRGMVEEWIAHVEAVQGFNDSLEQRHEELEALSMELSALGGAFVAADLEALHGGDGQDGAMLAEAAEIARGIEQLRVDCAPALLVFATEDAEIAPMLADMDSLLLRMEALIAAGNTGAGNEAAGSLYAKLLEYREAFTAFAAESEESVVLHEDIAYELAAAISSQAIALSDAAQAHMSALLTRSVLASRTTLLFTALVTLLSVLAGIFIAARITARLARPLRDVEATLRRAGETGDLHLDGEERGQLEQHATARDEVGRSIRAILAVIDRLVDISGALERVAARDLRVEVEPLGERDTMGVSLQRMCDNLNEMITEIRAAGDSVADGSSSLAASAQSLAQTSTEQAAAVEQVGAAIADLALQAQRTTENARHAAEGSTQALQVARVGSGSMDSMIQAMHEINESGKSIQKIIKTIDNIAFQTKILSLNAAVEAARAGIGGKGFAVVADEVRSLAADSARAAQDTGRMLSDSLDRVEQGMQIAGETAEAFQNIITGIELAARDVEDIYETVEAQSASIQQIDAGVQQVAESISLNAGTSEETAASSEEMSGQASQLHDMIARFSIRGPQQPPALPVEPPTPLQVLSASKYE